MLRLKAFLRRGAIDGGAKRNRLTSLTADEKRAAVGYGPLLPGASDSPPGLRRAEAASAAQAGSRPEALTPSLKYSPTQPRVPTGNSDGGQWVDAGGGE